MIPLATLFETHPNLKTQFNENIKNSLMTRTYESLHTILSKDLTNAKDFDFLAYFDDMLLKGGEKQLVLYTLAEFNQNKTSSDVAIGLAITLPNKNHGLVFLNNAPLILTEEEALEMENPFIFVGIDESVISKEAVAMNTRIEADCGSKMFSKWYHWAKIEWNACTSNCDVQYKWYTKYRWSHGWNFKQSGTLTKAGDVSEYYYKSYRIKLQLCIPDGSLQNYSVYEKHWENDAWTAVGLNVDRD